MVLDGGEIGSTAIGTASEITGVAAPKGQRSNANDNLPVTAIRIAA